MTGMGRDPILWTGLVMLAGTLGAMTARRVRIPAACGALAGGLVMAGISQLPGMMRADLTIVRSLLVAFVCFVIGAGIDAGALVRTGRRLLGETALQIAAVTSAVWIAGLLCGFGWHHALMLGLAFSATSPTAFMAAAAEAGARGAFSQKILSLAPLTLLISTLLVCGVGLPWLITARFLAQVAMGGVVGLLILVPLSRIETRGAVTACVGCGVFLLALFAMSFPVESLAILAIICGFLAGTFLPNREIVRDTLRGLALPSTMLLFAVSATFTSPHEIWLGAGAGILLVTARLAGLLAAGIATLGREAGLRHAAAGLPIAGFSCPGPAVLVMVGVILEGGIPQGSVMTALILSEFLGMIATRWALRRSGEAPLLAGNPDAWRASMS